jgi:type IV pilus assembly protein PilY1
LKKVAVLLTGVFMSCGSAADQDEAWLLRAELPGNVRPLLAIVVDTSADTARSIRVNEPYDAGRDYGPAVPAATRCQGDRVYWRRGAGPAPECASQAGLELAPPASLAGLQCEAARAALGRLGVFVASRAAQWRGDGEYWSAPAAHLTSAMECRADGDLFVAWDRAPLADPYILYTGNFLNYLNSSPAQADVPMAQASPRALARALHATADLEVALIRVDSDGPAGGYVARAPAASAIVAADLENLAAEAPAGAATIGETLEETIAWLSGAAVRHGTDARADPGAQDASAPGHYRSPFDHACRPVSLALLTATAPDEELPLPPPDLNDELPGAQGAATAWLTPDADALADPLVFVNLVARSFQHDAAVPASPQLSAAGIVPFAGDADPGIVFGLMAPALRARWPGNLFRYALRAPASMLAPPVVVDRDGEPAIDSASGLPWPDSTSLWSDAPDVQLLAGGAAGRLPPPDERRLYTDAASDRILDPSNRLPPETWPADLRTLGDPGRHAPLFVEYPESGRLVAFAATNDGLLHAFDATSGVELWAWVPRELMPRLPELARDETTAVRSHGIDGPLVVHRHDPDGDGRIDIGAGEHLWLVFGLGRGGGRYYALDISDVDDPKRLWSYALPDGEVDARAEPVVTRLVIAGSGQSAGDFVVLLAGGYDRRFDVAGATGDGRGNALIVVDAPTGRELWSGATGLASLPSAPRALDLDGDRYLDRAYLVDVVGQLWRVEFRSGRTAGELAEASLMARLGTGRQRFYATPDVSITAVGGEERIAIAVGSGWLARPRDTSAVDRLYVLFDRAVPIARTLTEADLEDVTSGERVVLPAAPGWFARLERHGSGEKIVGSTVTFGHRLHFQTYQPRLADDAEPCGPPRAVVRRHVLDVRTGLPRATAAESEEDEPEEIPASGLPVELRFGFPDRWADSCDGCRPRPFGMAGPQSFDAGYAGDPVKTSWRKLTPPASP